MVRAEAFVLLEWTDELGVRKDSTKTFPKVRLGVGTESLRESSEKTSVLWKRMMSRKATTTGEEGELRRDALDTVYFAVREDWAVGRGITDKRRGRRRGIHDADGLESRHWL